uniref:Uncharacterized protein n=2 Tax=Oryza nivara TaxID=4536 RepID=A0A0E0G335_ORYNI
MAAFMTKLGTFSLSTSCTTRLSLDTLVITSAVDPFFRSKYRARIRDACRSAVRVQQYPSKRHDPLTGGQEEEVPRVLMKWRSTLQFSKANPIRSFQLRIELGESTRGARTMLTLELNSWTLSAPPPKLLYTLPVMSSNTGIESPSPTAPRSPSTINTTSTASACMNTVMNDPSTGFAFPALRSSPPMAAVMPAGSGRLLLPLHLPSVTASLSLTLYFSSLRGYHLNGLKKKEAKLYKLKYKLSQLEEAKLVAVKAMGVSGDGDGAAKAKPVLGSFMTVFMHADMADMVFMFPRTSVLLTAIHILVINASSHHNTLFCHRLVVIHTSPGHWTSSFVKPLGMAVTGSESLRVATGAGELDDRGWAEMNDDDQGDLNNGVWVKELERITMVGSSMVAA